MDRALQMDKRYEDTCFALKCISTSVENGFDNQVHRMTCFVDSHPLSKFNPTMAKCVHEQSGHVLEIRVMHGFFDTDH